MFSIGSFPACSIAVGVATESRLACTSSHLLITTVLSGASLILSAVVEVTVLNIG